MTITQFENTAPEPDTPSAVNSPNIHYLATALRLVVILPQNHEIFPTVAKLEVIVEFRL
jgi:hypothetical protein